MFLLCRHPLYVKRANAPLNDCSLVVAVRTIRLASPPRKSIQYSAFDTVLGERLVERHQDGLAGGSVRQPNSRRPRPWGTLASGWSGSGTGHQRRQFRQDPHSAVRHERVVNVPGFSVGQGKTAHGRCGGQQTKKAELGEPAGDRRSVVRMIGHREGEPPVDVRKRELRHYSLAGFRVPPPGLGVIEPLGRDGATPRRRGAQLTAG